MQKSRILVVDDDIGIIKSVRANLQANGCEVLTAMDGQEAITTIEREMPDLVILDITMPRMDGIQVCSEVRQWSQVPIIMLSARHDVEEKALCLNTGADDYITKPFGVNELVARVKAVLRRTKEVVTSPSVAHFSTGDLNINFAERRVTVSDNEIKLTPTEYNLLQELSLNKGKVFSHATLLGRIWGPEYADEREYLRVFIGRLRKKIESDPANPRYIVTVSGVGYQFKSSNN
ncbi:MAG: response regulator transcription factor [Dehalococcoidales bacterium]|nr:response regulator transcription factor [Dehalococcoidales bacterium]